MRATEARRIGVAGAEVGRAKDPALQREVGESLLLLGMAAAATGTFLGAALLAVWAIA